MSNNAQKFKAAIVMGVLSVFVYIVLNTLIFSLPIIDLPLMSASATVKFLADVIKYILVFVVAILVYTKQVLKTKLPVMLVLIVGAAYAVLTYLIYRYSAYLPIIGFIRRYVTLLITGVTFSFIYLKVSKTVLPYK